MKDLSVDGRVETLASAQLDISKRDNRECSESAVLSDSLTFLLESNVVTARYCLNNDLDLNIPIHDPEFQRFLSSELSEVVGYEDKPIARRFSWPCLMQDDFDVEFHMVDHSEEAKFLPRREQLKTSELYDRRNLGRFRKVERFKALENMNSHWSGLIFKFRKFWSEQGTHTRTKRSDSSSLPDLTSTITHLEDENVNSLEQKLGVNDVQYAVFKPQNLSLNHGKDLTNGFVISKDDKEEVVAVLKSNSKRKVASYGLSRIIKCTTKQEYEVVDQSTGEYYVLKLTNDGKIFRMYDELFERPHPNLVEVTQLMTTLEENESDADLNQDSEDRVYYILLNACNQKTLNEYYVNTLPSMIDFGVLRNIVRGLLNALTYLHARSLALTKLKMKSVILCSNSAENGDFGEGEDLVAKIMDLDYVKPSMERSDVLNDLKLIGNLLFKFIEGKQFEKTLQFKSNLWNMCPKMFDFCITALGKHSGFHSAHEALIHPWFTT